MRLARVRDRIDRAIVGALVATAALLAERRLRRALGWRGGGEAEPGDGPASAGADARG